jgi:SnoaL-like domain
MLAALVLSVAACGGSGTGSALTQAERNKLDILSIDQIERKWHDAETHRNLAEMMSLWAPNAVWEADQNLTLVGKEQIRKFWVTRVFPAARNQHWFSDTASFRMRTTVGGDRGTLYFECHEIDSKTHKLLAVVGQELDVVRIGGRWLITKSVGSSPSLRT